MAGVAALLGRTDHAEPQLSRTAGGVGRARWTTPDAGRLTVAAEGIVLAIAAPGQAAGASWTAGASGLQLDCDIDLTAARFG